MRRQGKSSGSATAERLRRKQKQQKSQQQEQELLRQANDYGASPLSHSHMDVKNAMSFASLDQHQHQMSAGDELTSPSPPPFPYVAPASSIARPGAEDLFHNGQTPTCFPLLSATRDVFPELQHGLPLHDRKQCSLLGKLIRREMLEQRELIQQKYRNNDMFDNDMYQHLNHCADAAATNNANSNGDANATENTTTKRKKRKKRKKKKNDNDATEGQPQSQQQEDQQQVASTKNEVNEDDGTNSAPNLEVLSRPASPSSALNETSHSINDWLDMAHRGDGDKVPPPPELESDSINQDNWQVPPSIVQLEPGGDTNASMVDDVTELDQSVHHHSERLKEESTILPPPSLDRFPSQDTLTDLVKDTNGDGTVISSSSDHRIPTAIGMGINDDNNSWAQQSLQTASVGTGSASLGTPHTPPPRSRRSAVRAPSLPPQSPSTIDMIPQEREKPHLEPIEPGTPNGTGNGDDESDATAAQSNKQGGVVPTLIRHPLEVDYLVELQYYKPTPAQSTPPPEIKPSSHSTTKLGPANRSTATQQSHTLTTTIEGYHVASLFPANGATRDDDTSKSTSPTPMKRSDSNLSLASAQDVSLFDEWLDQLIDTRPAYDYETGVMASTAQANSDATPTDEPHPRRNYRHQGMEQEECEWIDSNLGSLPNNRRLSSFLDYIEPQLQAGQPIVPISAIKEACDHIGCVACQRSALTYLQMLEECMFGPRQNGCTIPPGSMNGPGTDDQATMSPNLKPLQLILNPKILQRFSDDCAGQEMSTEDAFDYMALEEGTHPLTPPHFESLRDILLDPTENTERRTRKNKDRMDRIDMPDLVSYIHFTRYATPDQQLGSKHRAELSTSSGSKNSKKRDSSHSTGGNAKNANASHKKTALGDPQLALRPMNMTQFKTLMDDFLPCGVEEDVLVAVSPTKDTRAMNVQQDEITAIEMNVAQNQRRVLDLLHKVQEAGWQMERLIAEIQEILEAHSSGPGQAPKNLDYSTMPLLKTMEATFKVYVSTLFDVLQAVTSERTHVLQDVQMELWMLFLRTVNTNLRLLETYYKDVEEELADQLGGLPKAYINAPMRKFMQQIGESKTELWTVVGNAFGIILSERVLKEWFARQAWQDMRVPEHPMGSREFVTLNEACFELMHALLQWTHTIMGGNVRDIATQRMKRTAHALELMQDIVEPLAEQYATVERYFTPERNRYFANLRSNIVLAYGVKRRMRLMDEGEVESMMMGVILMWRHVRLMQSRTVCAVRCPALPLHLKRRMYQEMRPWGMASASQVQTFCQSNKSGKRRILCIIAGLVYRWLIDRCLEWNSYMAEKELLNLDAPETTETTKPNPTTATANSADPSGPSKSSKRNKKKKEKKKIAGANKTTEVADDQKMEEDNASQNQASVDEPEPDLDVNSTVFVEDGDRMISARDFLIDRMNAVLSQQDSVYHI